MIAEGVGEGEVSVRQRRSCGRVQFHLPWVIKEAALGESPCSRPLSPSGNPPRPKPRCAREAPLPEILCSRQPACGGGGWVRRGGNETFIAEGVVVGARERFEGIICGYSYCQLFRPLSEVVLVSDLQSRRAASDKLGSTRSAPSPVSPAVQNNVSL